MILVLQHLAVQQERLPMPINTLRRSDNSPGPVRSCLRRLAALAAGALTSCAIVHIGFADLESWAVLIIMALGNKSKKKKGLVATLGRKTARRLQMTFRASAVAKTEGGNGTEAANLCRERNADAVRTSLPDDDSFMTTQTHLNASRPSSSSGSYVTAFCDSYPEANLKAVEAEETATAISAAISSLQRSILSSDRDRGLIKTEQLLSMRHGSFDTDSGKGGSPPPQHAGVEVPNSEAKSVETKSALVRSESRRSSTNKENKSVQAILDELQSKKVDDNTKAKDLAYLNQVLLQCKGFLHRYSVRQDMMSLGLMNALPALIESRNAEVETELDIFFKSESNDNLLGSDSRHPIDVFQAAYLALKNTPSADVLLSMLELIAKIHPSCKRLKSAMHVLQRGHLRNEYVQTEEGQVGQKPSDAVDAASPSQDSNGHLTSPDPLALRSSSPLPQIVRRPRSTSRVRRSGEQRTKIEVKNIPFIDDAGPTVSAEAKLNESSERNSNLARSSKLSQSEKHSPEKRQALSAPPPPPPPPPPAPEFLNSSLRKKKNAGSPVIVKSLSVYKKNCATNTVAWETVKPEVVVSRTTIWSDQSGADAEFNQGERERLEKVFERAPLCNSRRAAAQKRTRNISVDRKKGTVTVTGLTEKRALNLGIVLARFRPVTLEQLIAKIESSEIDELSLDYLSSLLKHFPAPEELAYFAKMTAGENLKDADYFCFLAARKPFLKLRIELKVLAGNIASDLARQLDCVRVLLNATDSLYNSPAVNIFFHRCLQYGNFLNQSTFAAGASGFTLSSLLTALNTKGNGAASNTRLVDVLAEYADEKLRDIVEILRLLEPAKKYSIDDLEKSEATLRRSLEMSLKSLQECGDAELYAHYSPIIMDSITKCGQLSRSIKKVRHNENRLKEYYCGSSMNLENMLETLYKAFRLFQDALSRAEARAARVQRQERAGAGSDSVLGTGLLRRKRFQYGTIKPPNVKDLIEIINSNECR